MSDTEPHDRLHVFLARRGIASRRACAEIVLSGRVKVDGIQVFEPGFKVRPAMLILLDDSPVPHQAEKLRSIILNKPPGYICSTRRQSASGNSGTIYDLIRTIPERLHSIGRLDKESEGLIVLSNDGYLTELLTHPRHSHHKTYLVTVSGKVSKGCLNRLNASRELDGEAIQPVDITVYHAADQHTVLQFILREGRNRQIRRMCKNEGLEVARLVRSKIGNFQDTQLPPGEWRDLRPDEIELLKGNASR